MTTLDEEQLQDWVRYCKDFLKIDTNKISLGDWLNPRSQGAKALVDLFNASQVTGINLIDMTNAYLDLIDKYKKRQELDDVEYQEYLRLAAKFKK